MLSNVEKLLEEKQINEISILAFSNQDLFEDYANDIFKVIPFVKVHRIFVYRICSELREMGYVVYLIPFDKAKYLSWLTKHSKMHNQLTRAEWTGLQKQ